MPVNFPQDICMLRIEGKFFAVTLSFGKSSNGTSDQEGNTMKIFLRENGKFREIYKYESRYMTKIDCKSTKNSGFIAVVNTLTENDVASSEDLVNAGSFVIRIKVQPKTDPSMEILQRFASLHQNGVNFGLHGDGLFLIFSYNTFQSSPLNMCTIFKLGSLTFNPLDDLPCQNARTIEIFTTQHTLMVFIGNYKENNGTTNTFSPIMRYDLNQKKFVEHQRIYTNAIAVGKYFFLEKHQQREHFLFIGNSFEINEFGAIDYEIPSIIYKKVNGFFIPMQTVNLRQVKAVLPIVVSSINDINLELLIKLWVIAGQEQRIPSFDCERKQRSSNLLL